MDIVTICLEYLATFIEGVLFLAAVTLLSEERFRGGKLVLSVCGFAVLYTALISYLNSLEAFSFVTMVVAGLFVFLAAKITSRGGVLLRAAALFLVWFFLISVDYLLLYALAMIVGRSPDVFKSFEIMLQPGLIRVLFVGLDKILQIAAFFLCMRFYPKLRALGRKALVFMLCASAAFFVALQVLTAMIQNRSMIVMQIAVILSTVFIVLAMIAMLVAFGVNSRYQEKKRQSDMMALTNRMLEKNYADMQTRSEVVRRQMHDFKNHLRTIDGLVPEDSEAKRYIAALLETSYAQTRECSSGNGVIDSIVNCKLAEAQMKGIAMKYDILFEAPLPVAAVDLCAILSNQLDNAIEACEKMPPDRRHIDVDVYQRNRLLYFKVVNDAPGDPFDEERRLRTSKDNADGLHGLGIRNITETVRRNGGELQNEYRDGKFYSTAMISLGNRS